MLKPGGSMTVIEGDHGSAYFHPDSEYARGAIPVPGRAAEAGRRQREHRRAYAAASFQHRPAG